MLQKIKFLAADVETAAHNPECDVWKVWKEIPQHKTHRDFIHMSTGWPNKNRTFLRYHIFAATTYIIMRFLLKCSEITAENNKQTFF